MPLHKIEEMERVHCKGQFLPILPSWKRAEGQLPLVPSNVGVPEKIDDMHRQKMVPTALNISPCPTKFLNNMLRKFSFLASGY